MGDVGVGGVAGDLPGYGAGDLGFAWSACRCDQFDIGCAVSVAWLFVAEQQASPGDA